MLGSAEKLDHLARTVAQGGIGGKGEVGPHKVLVGRLGDHMGQPLAAQLRILGHGDPPVFDKDPVGPAEALGHGDLAGLEVDPFPVPGRVGRQNLLDPERARLVDDHVAGLAIQIAVALAGEQILDFKLFVKDEIDVAPVGDGLGHGMLLWLLRGLRLLSGKKLSSKSEVSSNDS